MELWGFINWVCTWAKKNVNEIYETVEHIYKNAPPGILELSLTNAEELDLGKSVLLAQKQITLFNKLLNIVYMEYV